METFFGKCVHSQDDPPDFEFPNILHNNMTRYTPLLQGFSVAGVR